MEDLFGVDAWGDEPDWAKDDEEEGEGGEETGNGLVGAQHVLLVIDCHPDMFGDDAPVDLALQLALVVLKQYIRDTVTLKIGKRNGVGLLLYHTTNTKKNRIHREKEGGDDDDEDEELEEEEDDDSTDQGSTVHVLLPLIPPGVQQVQTIRSCLKKDRDLRQEFCSNGEEEESRIAPLQTALEESIRMFRKAKCVKEGNQPGDPVDSRSIWIFTNRENPYPSSAHLIQNVARDAKEQDIQIVVWPLLPKVPPPSSTLDFSWEVFFHNIVSYNPFPHRLQSLDELQDGLEDLKRYGKKIRRSYWGPLCLPDWKEHEDKPTIMIDWFRFVQMAKKPTKVQIDQQTKRETIKVRQLVDDRGSIFASFKPGSTEERSKPQPGLQRIRQYAKFGGELVPLSKEDMTEIRHQANGRRNKSSLILLGFKPKDAIPSYHTMSPAYFIYPNDEVVKGSREAFVELHAAMLRKNVLAIGEVLHRINWTSNLVAIYPIEEVPEESTCDSVDLKQKRPPGMMVVTLPFEDDMRTLEPDAATLEIEAQLGSRDLIMEDIAIKCEGTTREDDPEPVTSIGTLHENSGSIASEELVTAAMELVGRQRLEGWELGEDFANAALVEFFNYLESVALELPASEEEEEFDTRLDDGTVLEAARDQIARFQQCLPEDAEKPKTATARKRKLVADDSGLDWEHIYRTDALEDCKVPDLKKYLRSAGEPLSGNKAAIVLRVTHHLRLQLQLEKKQEQVTVKMET